MRVRGLKRVFLFQRIRSNLVAPRAGAWIETRLSELNDKMRMSHPVRVRGLKRLV